MGDLDGKIALVTGGSRGIGRGIAERLARDGALVAVHYGSNEAAAQQTAAAIAEAGGRRSSWVPSWAFPAMWRPSRTVWVLH
ncbi:SDR family NAD(P)-dependent oxidoreductase [Nocardia brasiliensis]|uniref:SDR family NAD(P)-dependent oxidoreductase n=1 Tax=Nocardia brasiliensis TaxID=37326 RepID=UPI0024577848|nr:SDR family NAD(P)-dependent oxidoreductase [Nocardia brasiliensis]